MIVINIFGSPGTGKSTTAAGLFYHMKLKGINVELVTEYAKDLVWDENHKSLSDQIHICTEQTKRLSRLQNKVDYAITDSPLVFSIIYSSKPVPKELYSLITNSWSLFDNYCYLLKRNPNKKHIQAGRLQTQEECIALDLPMRSLFEVSLAKRKVILTTLDPVKEIEEDILNEA